MSSQPLPRSTSPPPSSTSQDSPDTSITTTEPDSDAEWCHHTFPSVSNDDLISPSTSSARRRTIPVVRPKTLDPRKRTLERSAKAVVNFTVPREPASGGDASSTVYYDALSYVLDAEDGRTSGSIPNPRSPTCPSIVVTPALGDLSTARAQAALPPTLREQLPLSEPEYRAVLAARIARLEAEVEAKWQAMETPELKQLEAEVEAKWRARGGPSLIREQSDDAMDICSD